MLFKALLTFALLAPLPALAEQCRIFPYKAEGDVVVAKLSLQQKLAQQGAVARKRNGNLPREWNEYLHYDPWDYQALKDLKARLEKMEREEFGTAKRGLNDEADAFRHFMLSFFMVELFGERKALRYLENHERGLFNMASLMDRHNNRVAVRESVRLLNEGAAEEDAKDFAREVILDGRLVVLQPVGLLPIEDPKGSRRRFEAWAHQYLRCSRY